MKVYLASSFNLANRVEAVANQLKSLGHTITLEWWHTDLKRLEMSDDAWYDFSVIEDVYNRNLKAINEADVVILIAPEERPKKFNGANIEIGYAIANNKPVYSVGKLERSAMYAPVEKYSSLKELMVTLCTNDVIHKEPLENVI